MLVQSAGEERRGLACADVAYEEEKMRIEDEYLAGRARVKERLLEGLEERRKKAREEKEGEGTSGGVCSSLSLLIYRYIISVLTRVLFRRWIT